MLALVLVLGSPIVFFFVREGSSETCRCPYCSQLYLGTYHRLKCLILSEQGHNIPVLSEPHAQECRSAGCQEVSGRAETAPNDYKRRILHILPGFLGQRAGVKGVTADLSRHAHVAS
jgi:hypothetical protein